MTKKLYKHIGIFIGKVCTGTEKSTKKEDLKSPQNFIIHSLTQLSCFQLHSIIHIGILLQRIRSLCDSRVMSVH